MKKGLFITFEGADGCGKTTQQGLCAKYLEEKGVEVLLSREPGATALGVKLREILLHYPDPVASECETFLYLADRAQHIQEKIIPALEEGKIILCDRHTDSNIAYQGYGRGIDIDKVKYLNDIAVAGVKPDITFVFDVDSEIAQERVGKTKDRLESLGIEFHKKVRNGYLEIAKNEPNRVHVINSNLGIEEVFAQVKKVLDEKVLGR